MPDPLKNTHWPSLDPGNLNHRVQIQQQLKDAYGNVATTKTVLRCWANIVTIKLTETTKDLVSEVTHTVSIRFRRDTGIAPGMFVIYRAHSYRIQAIENVDERDIILKLRCLALNDAANPSLVESSILA
jgi:SPP1 family predicted phage head-tail adaptor